jgi:hypothetical protein
MGVKVSETTQKDEDHADNQTDREGQFELHIGNRGADGGRAIGQDLQLHRGGQSLAQLGQKLFDAIDY